VSPLQESWLRRISPLLAEALVEYKAPAAKGTGGKGGRDTTWQIRIGTKYFPLKASKGKKKVAILPWDELHTALKDDPVVLPQFHALKGKLVHHGLELLSGVKVSEIMRIAGYVNPHEDMVSHWPRNESFHSTRESGGLCQHLDLVLKMTRLKKGGKSVAFLTLQSDGNGLYWFKPQRNFYVAVTDSLGSLENLTDELGESIDEPAQEAVNRTYRRLASVLEE